MAQAEVTGSLDTALAQAARFLDTRPDLAEEQAREILKAMPDQPSGLAFLGAALRRQGKTDDARAVLAPLLSMPKPPVAVFFELGVLLGDLGDPAAAIPLLARATVLRPGHTQAWRALGDQYTLLGDTQAADAAYAWHIKACVNDPRLLEAASALCENRLDVAEHKLRPFLKQNPSDVTALRMLAEVGARLGRYEDAERILARVLQLAPSFAEARHNYASVLHRANKPAEALAQAEILEKADPRNPGYRALKAATLSQLGEYAQASQTYGRLLQEFPNQPKGWMSYGHTLKTLGRQQDSIEAYRRAIAQMPGLGEVYWSLANLKTFRFTDAEIATMRAQLERTDLAPDDRFHFEFALGKALEDAGDYAQSFAHYDAGNALRRKALPYRAGQTHLFAERLKAVFTLELFASRPGVGSPAPDPIFVVGLPRSGSTLIEQILASHSAVEGTMELHDVAHIARELGSWTPDADKPSYPEVTSTVPPERFRALGEDYLARTRIHRKLGRPFFIDKMPNNFLHAGLIQLMLPNAKIIDARRHPMGCCFSCFKQHFARGQSYTYGLEDLGRYYADYVGLMAHYDAVLPGRVHRVFYERMVADPETEIRRLLDYCGLAFEESCLKFYQNDRSVRTASSEQVRMPIFSDGLDQWRHYEPWLGPLKDALGGVLGGYGVGQ
ncbi:MAG TPA: sulfotransferase [Rhizomicrobium sp.]|jgi:tetratricopeptide (TPR) repeat protein|nr:sulfotransferase [Rhizomicrobium sp.]